jgi:hypothetical protein
MFTRRLRHLSVVALAAIVALACFLSASLHAQNISTAELHGTVHDSSGAVIPNAAITISDASKGFSRATTSDGQGEYQLLLLPPGTYVLTVTSPGFAKLTQSNVVLTVGERAELRLTLAVGGSETVNVTAGADIIETQRSSQSTTGPASHRESAHERTQLHWLYTDHPQIARDAAPLIGAIGRRG